jgi:hypothetical protein
MKLKSIHILIIIVILGGVLLFLINTTEKYENAKVVILNPRNQPRLGISAERENNITCDTSNPNYPMCLDIFKIEHPRTIVDVNNL